MKLRNKKTGEIIDPKKQVMALIVVRTDDREVDGYSSIAELKEEWEDYKPTKALIKDEKIRKAVRAWADMNDIRFIHMCAREDKRNARIVGQNAEGRTFTMEINDEYDVRVSFGDYKECYTIAELCGEEEE